MAYTPRKDYRGNQLIKEKVIEYLQGLPFKSMALSLIARNLSIDYKYAIKVLKSLEEEQQVESFKMGIIVYYKIKPQCLNCIPKNKSKEQTIG